MNKSSIVLSSANRIFQTTVCTNLHVLCQSYSIFLKKSENHENVVGEKQSAISCGRFSKALMLDCYPGEFHGCSIALCEVR